MLPYLCAGNVAWTSLSLLGRAFKQGFEDARDCGADPATPAV